MKKIKITMYISGQKSPTLGQLLDFCSEAKKSAEKHMKGTKVSFGRVRAGDK